MMLQMGVVAVSTFANLAMLFHAANLMTRAKDLSIRATVAVACRHGVRFTCRSQSTEYRIASPKRADRFCHQERWCHSSISRVVYSHSSTCQAQDKELNGAAP